MAAHPDRYIVGLTGGISSGKSTAADEFDRLGVQVIKADDLGREATAPNQPAYNEIVGVWPEHQMDDGSLDRFAMRALLLDPAQKAQLEEIVQPRVEELLQIYLRQRIGEYAVYESALLKRKPMFDRILAISIDEDTQAKRYRKRGDMGSINLSKIQADDIELCQIADNIISNNATEGHLRASVKRLHNNIYIPEARDKKLGNQSQPN